MTINDWVLVADTRHESPVDALAVGRIVEILQKANDFAASDRVDRADSVLLEYYRCDGFDHRYSLPKLKYAGWLDVDPKVMSNSTENISICVQPN